MFTDPTRLHYYDATIVTGSVDEGRPALAIAGFSKRLAIVNGVMATDLDGDGRRDLFGVCTSSDGVHLTLWAGPPPGGRREWHRYVYLGNDLDPTCSDAKPSRTRRDQR